MGDSGVAPKSKYGSQLMPMLVSSPHHNGKCWKPLRLEAL